MKSFESTGRTVEEAISAGLEHLGLSIGEVTVDILEEGSKGLFGLFGSRQAKVRLTVRDEEPERDTRSIFADSLNEYRAEPAQRERTENRLPKKPQEPKPAAPAPAPRPAAKPADPAPAPRPAARPAEPVPVPRPAAAPAARAQARGEEKPKQREARPTRPPRPQPSGEAPAPAPQADPETPAGAAQKFLQEVTALMEVAVSVSVSTDEEGNVKASMDGDALGVLIGRRGETLDALQYLTGLYVNRGRENYTRVTLDSEGYRAKREEALVRLATRMANRAQKTGRRVTMEPMNPYERRILHSALQNHPGVTTHSEGEEPNRHVVITLNKALKAEDAADGGSADE